MFQRGVYVNSKHAEAFYLLGTLTSFNTRRHPSRWLVFDESCDDTGGTESWVEGTGRGERVTTGVVEKKGDLDWTCGRFQAVIVGTKGVGRHAAGPAHGWVRCGIALVGLACWRAGRFDSQDLPTAAVFLFLFLFPFILFLFGRAWGVLAFRFVSCLCCDHPRFLLSCVDVLFVTSPRDFRTPSWVSSV